MVVGRGVWGTAHARRAPDPRACSESPRVADISRQLYSLGMHLLYRTRELSNDDVLDLRFTSALPVWPTAQSTRTSTRLFDYLIAFQSSAMPTV